MKALTSWLRDFVEIPVDLNELVTMLNMRGFEVTAVELLPKKIEGSDENDAVLDLEITTNRPDCMNIVGLAREIATAYDTSLHWPETQTPGTTNEVKGKTVSVILEDTELCPRYTVAIAEVKVTDSPAWLANRLHACGIRPINSVVDISNYVLMEMGHPTHAFDLDRLTGRELRIRRALTDERIRTIDGVERTLNSNILIIADAKRPQAVAGIMGGSDSEVNSNTRVVAFESAYFDPISVRRGSKHLGLNTEASHRFERGTDVSATLVALERVRELLVQTGSGQSYGPIVDQYPIQKKATTIKLRYSRILRILGQSVDKNFIAKTLKHLGFALKHFSEGLNEDTWWDVTVPSHRVDVSREIDLIEEVIRHHGYDRLPLTFPALTVVPQPPDPKIERTKLVRRVATAAGFSEVVTFSFIPTSAGTAFTDSLNNLIKIKNPLSAKFSVLRPSLIPGVIETVSHNRRREQQDVRVFEIGQRFSNTGETCSIALAWTGSANVDHWSTEPRDVDFFDIKGTVEKICISFGLEPTFHPTTRPYLMAGLTAEIRATNHRNEDQQGLTLGVLGQLSPHLVTKFGLNHGDKVYVAEILLEELDQVSTLQNTLRVKPLPRFPAIVRDVSILVSRNLPAASIRETIRVAAGETLVNVREFDRYYGKGVPDECVSLSFRLTFRTTDRTLTDEEVQISLDATLKALETTHHAKLR